MAPGHIFDQLFCKQAGIIPPVNAKAVAVFNEHAIQCIKNIFIFGMLFPVKTGIWIEVGSGD